MIHRLGADDLDRLVALHAACFAEAWSRDFLRRLLTGPGVTAWATGDDSFLILRIAADEAEILSLGTRPAARRRDHARHLLEHAVATARSGGASRLFLEVAANNAPARALYRGRGFTEVGRRPRYYPDGSDALVLSRAT